MGIIKNENFELINDDGKLLIKVYKVTDMKKFSEIVLTDPRISISLFSKLQKALSDTDFEGVYVGVYKNEIEIEISSDEMTATVCLNMNKDRYNRVKKTIVNNILSMLFEHRVDSGIDYTIFDSDMELQRKIPIAKGYYPTNGVDAKLSYYKLSEKKTEITSDGKVDHYQINLIDEVKVGDWLGEKIPRTNGVSGRSVVGKEIPAKAGRDYKLKYERDSIEEVEVEDGKIHLISKVDGAVSYKGTKLAVNNHLIIPGDVNYSTGNINFNGSITIEGVVEDNFIVIATKDISINGAMGIGAVALIESTEGNIFIKGGVNGKGTAQIKAGKNVYLKYANEVTITASEMINVGLYTYDSILDANKIILSPQRGKIVGGKLTAHHLIEAASIGNRSEKKTEIEVKGFDRATITAKLEAIKIRFGEVIFNANKLKRKLEIFEVNQDRLDEKGNDAYKSLFIQYENLLDDIQNLNLETQILEDVLETRGDGEVKIYNMIHPKSMLEIKRLQHKVNSLMKCSFYVQNNKLHQTSI